VFASLRTRLTISHLAVIVLAMVLSGFLLLSSLERYFLQAAEDSLLAQARITAQALIPGVITEGPSVEPGLEGSQLAPAYNAVQQQQVSNLSLQAENLSLPASDPSLNAVDLAYLADASLQLSAQLETRIRILDTQGIVLVDSQQADRDLLGAELRTDELVAQALEGQHASRIAQDSGKPTMHVALPALVEGRVVGVVFLSQPLHDVTAVLRDLRTRWLLSTAVALFLSAVGGLLLSRAIANPLRRLTVAAKAVARGRFDQQVPVNSRDELGHLSRAFNDMTNRLRAARQMQVNFVSDVSHELRTPLTTIKGMVETLRDGAVDDPPVRDRFLETIELETDRLIRLINDLLILSRTDSEALNLRREVINLAQLAEATTDLLTSRAASRQVALQVKANSNAPLAWADPDRVEQILVNLLDNAIKYSLPGGTVTISVGAQPDASLSVLTQVRDEGIGIPADDLPRIGQRFYRADKARSRSEGGSGLGLAIARALVQAHGGRLWVESQEGKGTVVSFTLPNP
jgi:two-component system OmpR family sensor kinase/two-component system sensor histidine kinase BaeS